MMTINFHNHTGNKNLYLFFDYADTPNTVGVTNFANMTYYQPWKDGSLDLSKPYTCSFEWIESGTFWYLVANQTGASTISNNPKTAMGTADPNWVGGFFELTSLESVKKAYFDITNVDQIGLFCGIKFSDGETCGYGLPAKDFIPGMEKACSLAKGTSAKVSINATDGNTYSKLWGPTVPTVTSQYSGTYDTYLKAIKANGTSITIKADSTIGSPHSGTQFPSFTFVGSFSEPATLPQGSTLKKSDVILWFKAEDCTSKGITTYIYFTSDAINGGTIMSGNSPKGMYVYPAFEYADPTNPSTIDKGGWAEDVPLNWTATGSNAVKDTTCFQAMISSVGRDLITALNLGYIGVTPAHNAFVYGDASTYASQSTQDTYINRWNKYITDHSDSYGMAYSDNAHAKVQFNPPIDGTIDCYILKQDDPDTKNYYSKTT